MAENTNKIDHPSHYNTGNIECIEAMRRMFGDRAVETFCQLTAFKYYFRAGNKAGEDKADDIGKAEWYLEYYKKLIELKYPKYDGVEIPF